MDVGVSLQFANEWLASGRKRFAEAKDVCVEAAAAVAAAATARLPKSYPFKTFRTKEPTLKNLILLLNT